MCAAELDPTGRRRRTVLIYESVVVDRPFSELAPWLPEAQAARDGLAEAATEAFAGGVVGHGQLLLGAARTRRETIVLPVLWESSTPGTIEAFEGDLQLAPFGDSRCHLSISASHRSDRNVDAIDGPRALLDAAARVRVFLNLLAAYYFSASPRD